jgi:hypothetical protein
MTPDEVVEKRELFYLLQFTDNRPNREYSSLRKARKAAKKSKRGLCISCWQRGKHTDTFMGQRRLGVKNEPR